ncbi:sigma-54-dependent Fis family transcriptional regulator [Qaidamihabitans albus]|uniref:sigma-54-dependent Fis family transcriptional regulator n=1 Tax=Qaidamihabitans albus TaxID=2795733 RepID=UPI001F238AAD|nr:helix-turn-helix domain-containing protein [Qaidamihabitans albus]
MDGNPLTRSTTMRRGGAPSDTELADARIRFLTSESVELGEVRDAILTSWWRSRRSQVPADRIEVPYFDDHDLDAAWIRSAQPLLKQLDEQLDGQPISLILTDPAGVVVSQHTGDSDLHRHLESVDLVPGFSYGEQFVGTNGIGTALEDGRPRHVFGHEHYAEHLENLACVGVPIQHPLSGKTVGAVDLTCWSKDAGGLLIALARTAAEQIRQALLTTTSVRELELFQAYLQACRRTGGIVMALNDDVVMMNDYARQLLEPADQSMLLGRARQALTEGGRTSTTLALPSGSKVRMHCRSVTGPTRGASVGGVLHVELIDADAESETSGPTLPMFLPGTVGSAPLWLHCCHEVDASYDWGEWLALVGEPGVGKFTLADCVYRRRRPGERPATFDAAEATDAGWLERVRRELEGTPPSALVFRHVDQLDAATAAALAAVLGELRSRHQADAPWVVVTLAPGTDTRPDLTELLALVPRTVQVPPLRYRIEDLRQLVPFLLNKLSHGGQLTCSPGAMKLLMRSTWPGNVAQLYRVLKHVARHRRRTGAIQPTDLPAEYHAVTRRALSQLESIERDAIVRSLHNADGNKAQAAKSLGMSRATIYRKLHDYGIVTASRSH